MLDGVAVVVVAVVGASARRLLKPKARALLQKVVSDTLE
jgi:hypothetical protein